MLSALANVAAMVEARGKRISGSFARQRKMTLLRAGEMLGLIKEGGVGVALRCCIMRAMGLFPWKEALPCTIQRG